MAKRWEYMTRDQLDAPMANALGAQGWELVAIYNGRCWFKRRVKRVRTD